MKWSKALSYGESKRQAGETKDAIRYFKKALVIAQKNSSKKEHAITLERLGQVYSDIENYHEAVDYYEKGLEIVKENGDKRLECQMCNGIGFASMRVGDNKKGLKYHKQALAVALRIGDSSLIAWSYDGIGNTYSSLCEYDNSIKCHKKAIDLFKQLNDEVGLGICYGHFSDLYRKQGKYHDAIRFAESYGKMGAFHQAFELLEKCLDIANTIGNKKLEGNACSLLGQIYHSLHKENQGHQAWHDTDDNIAKSEQYLRKALDCFDFLFQHLHQRDDFKVSIFDLFIQTYKFLTTVLIEREKVQEALLVSDGGRARALGDRLTFKYGMNQEKCLLSKPLTYPDVETVLLNDGFSILHYSLLSNSLTVWILAKDSIVFKQSERQEFDSSIETLTEEEKGKDENSMTRLFANTITRAYEMMEIQESVTCENRSLDDCVTSKDAACESLSRDDGTQEDHIDKASQPLETLYNCLVAPFLSNVQHDEIVIVPDGPMYRVPFAALRDPNTGQYLSDTKRIRLAPSIAVLKALNECPVDHHSQKGALIVGDPSVGEVMFRGKKRVFERLLSADREVTFLSAILRQSTKLTGEQATKDAVLEKLKEGSAVIHIAAHGSSDNGEIALAPNVSSERQGIPQEDDYVLKMKEVQEIGIKAQLVVLSCCYSGRGEIRAEGMVGLSRAFLAAGARSVVASLWAIDDSVTLSFMVSFYSYLTRGESASVSLHKAMYEIRKEGYRDPKYWAPFFLIGDDVILKLN